SPVHTTLLPRLACLFASPVAPRDLHSFPTRRSSDLQPWVIEGVLPTYYAASGLTVSDLVISLSIFLLLYTVLLVIGVKVMLHAIKAGPKSDQPPRPAQADPVSAAVDAY